MHTLRLVEIRSYKLKPGTGATFHSLVSEQSVPLLRAARMDAATGLLDLERLGGMLKRIKGRILHHRLPRAGQGPGWG